MQHASMPPTLLKEGKDEVAPNQAPYRTDQHTHRESTNREVWCALTFTLKKSKLWNPLLLEVKNMKAV